MVMFKLPFEQHFGTDSTRWQQAIPFLIDVADDIGFDLRPRLAAILDQTQPYQEELMAL